MTETRPRGEQLRFESANTGSHILDDYLENSERGGRPLYDLMADLFGTDGNFSSGLFQFRIQNQATNDYSLQYRAGTYVDPEEAWVTISDEVFDLIVTACLSAKTSAETAATTSTTNATLTATNATSTSSDATQTASDRTATETFKNQAEAAQTAAEAAVNGSPMQGRLEISSADSPYTITNAQRGFVIDADTSAGDVIINLPQISTVTSPFNLRIKKNSGDVNSLIINRGGTDTLAEAGGNTTSKSIVSIGGVSLTADVSEWGVYSFGGGLGNVVTDVITSHTPGVTTTLSLTEAPGVETNVAIFFDGVFQNSSTYSVSGSTVTLSEPIPLGVLEIECRSSKVLTIGTTANETVGVPQLNSSVYASQAEAESGTDSTKIMTPERTAQAIQANGSIVLDTPQPTTSGSSKEFTLSSGTKKFSMMISKLSCTGTVMPDVQIGDTSGYATSGYEGVTSSNDGGTAVVSHSADIPTVAPGFQNAPAQKLNGFIDFRLVDEATDTWDLIVVL